MAGRGVTAAGRSVPGQGRGKAVVAWLQAGPLTKCCEVSLRQAGRPRQRP